MEMSRGDPPRLIQSANRVWLTLTRALTPVLALSVLLAAPAFLVAQGGPGTQNGEWHYLGGDAAHTRYSPLDQIDGSNFEDLEVAWIWRADNFGPTVDYAFKSTPSFVDGMLFTVVSERRQVVAIDPATGETLWVIPRAQHVAVGTLHAAELWKGSHVRRGGWPRGDLYYDSRLLPPRARRQDRSAAGGLRKALFRLKDFLRRGSWIALEDLVRGWLPFEELGQPLDHYAGIPREVGMITSFSAAHRGEQRDRGEQFPRAGLQPDTGRERAG